MKGGKEVYGRLVALERVIDLIKSSDLSLPASRRVTDYGSARGSVDVEQASIATKPSEDGPSISRLLEAPVGATPTDDDLIKLALVVLRKYPHFEPDENRAAEFWNDYRRSFEALSRVMRADKPDPSKSVGWWIDEFCELLGGTVRTNAFLTAALAAGDISYVPGNQSNISWELGLKIGGVGRRPSDAWRKVIETGELLRPSPLARALSPEEQAMERMRKVAFGE